MQTGMYIGEKKKIPTCRQSIEGGNKKYVLAGGKWKIRVIVKVVRMNGRVIGVPVRIERDGIVLGRFSKFGFLR